jgi:hypothetical protein
VEGKKTVKSNDLNRKVKCVIALKRKEKRALRIKAWGQGSFSEN